jgi:hypothetical protein
LQLSSFSKKAKAEHGIPKKIKFLEEEEEYTNPPVLCLTVARGCNSEWCLLLCGHIVDIR